MKKKTLTTSQEDVLLITSWNALPLSYRRLMEATFIELGSGNVHYP